MVHNIITYRPSFRVMCFDATGTPLKELAIYNVVTVIKVNDGGTLRDRYALKEFNRIVFDPGRFLPLWDCNNGT